mmetsp:Transcript_38399/g.43593  ORF Transcript_38399/g.43593 Transcript_38399/m.43593 type:complete len:277 (-) Transcript_38399:191-1021(-)
MKSFMIKDEDQDYAEVRPETTRTRGYAQGGIEQRRSVTTSLRYETETEPDASMYTDADDLVSNASFCGEPKKKKRKKKGIRTKRSRTVARPGDLHDKSNSSMMAALSFKNSAHPGVMVFHLLFRTVALIMYILEGLLGSIFSGMITLIVIILCAAADFWVIKNISGRKLVGLRWWSYINDDGQEVWIYESNSRAEEVNSWDEKVFWITLWVYPIIWLVLAVSSILSLQFGIATIVVNLVLTFANLWGFRKCDNHKKMEKKLKRKMAAKALQRAVAI